MPATNPATVAESVAPMGRSYAHFAGAKGLPFVSFTKPFTVFFV